MHTVDKIFLPSAAAAWHKNWNGTTFKLCKTTPEEFITTNMLKPTVEKVQLLSRFGDCFAQLSEVTPAVSVVTNEKGACIKTQVCVFGSDIALRWNFKFLLFCKCESEARVMPALPVTSLSRWHYMCWAWHPHTLLIKTIGQSVLVHLQQGGVLVQWHHTTCAEHDTPRHLPHHFSFDCLTFFQHMLVKPIWASFLDVSWSDS